MDDQDDIVREFLVESYENLDQLDRDLVSLEKNPQDGERLASVFRTIHTIKGTCGFLAFPKLEAVAHAGESLLSRLRDGRLLLSAEITSGLLALVDAVRRILKNIETNRQEGKSDYGAVIVRLTQLRDGPPASPAAPPAPAPIAPSAAIAEENPARDGQAGGVADANIRVDVGLLDKLVNLVGELVLARNQVLQFTATRRDPVFLHTTQRLNQITTELQEGVMKTRMQPIGNILNKFPRQVRDLAVACDKQIQLTVEGEETELDKTLLEAIKDPLTHLVRNAVDHGIETPQERRAAGKPPEGRLSLHAFHEGGQVNIEIADDGRGIDPERIRAKALERGLISRDQAGRLGERELLQMIFLPGFSTAEKVTNVSGRGVGMDVVKTNIEKIGGAVDVVSRPGQGARGEDQDTLDAGHHPGPDRLQRRRPLRHSASKSVGVGPPRRREGQARLRVDSRRSGLPSARQSAAVGLFAQGTAGRTEPTTPPPQGGRVSEISASGEGASGPLHIAVLQAGDRSFGLVVEAINDTEEIVVKPLSKHLKGIPLFAGATIMGDGRVSLILDVLGLAQRAGVVSEARRQAGRTGGRRWPEPARADPSPLPLRATAGAWPYL